MQLARAVGGENHHRPIVSTDRSTLRDGDLEVGEEFEQECLEFVIRAVDFIDQQNRLLRMTEASQHRALDQEFVAVDINIAAAFALTAQRQHLAREIPFIKRGRRVDAFVALQAQQPAAEHTGNRFGCFGLTDTGCAFQEQRLAQCQRKISGGREPLIGQIERRAQCILKRMRAVDTDDFGSDDHGAYRIRAAGTAPPRALMARNTFSGVIGKSLMRTPTALKIAFATAGSTGLAHISPMPFAPNGPSGAGRSRTTISWGQISPGPGIRYSLKSRGPSRGSG